MTLQQSSKWAKAIAPIDAKSSLSDAQPTRAIRILLISRQFYPAIGGLEIVGHELASGWRQCGHEVRVLTVTPLGQDVETPLLPVIRRAHCFERWRHAAWADVVVHNGISLREYLPAAVLGRPTLFVHHNLLAGAGGRTRFLSWLKRHVARGGANVAVSEAVRATLPANAVLIANPLRKEFRSLPDAEHERHGLLYVGRLVSDKGVDTCIRALAILHDQGGVQTLAIYGDGPERAALEQLSRDLGVQHAVQFRGWASATQLRDAYERAQCLLIPSRYEPFGITAVEAIAAHCIVVGSNVGGLPEAIGPCGILVSPDMPKDFAEAIEKACSCEARKALLSARMAHLERFAVEAVMKRYDAVIRQELER